ncbi:MAG: succinate dehydrogenase, partial [Thermoanaerobaculia bacterium]
LGLVRDRAGLEAALGRLPDLWQSLPDGASEVRSLVAAAFLVAEAALRREESRGAHFRADFPEALDEWRHRQFFGVEIGARGPECRFEPAPALEQVSA